MRIASVQLYPQFGKIEDNIAKAADLMSGVRADLFVLPELCFTGYTFKSLQEATSLAESADGGFSVIRIRELSNRLNSAIVFGFPERTTEGLYNSCACVTPSGDIQVYRKLHLFNEEKSYFLPGNQPPKVINFHGCRLGMMICFDWIFPEMARSLALLGAHIICHPANLVLPYCQSAMVTRSIENRVFSVTANRFGRETRGGFDNKFTGKSQILSPKGQILFRGSDDKEEIGVADINYKDSEDKRISPKNIIWDDRRSSYYLSD